MTVRFRMAGNETSSSRNIHLQNAGGDTRKSLKDSASVLLQTSTASELGRCTSHIIMKAFAGKTCSEDAATKLVGYRAFSGLLPQSVGLVYVLESHPELALVPELTTEVHALLGQLKFTGTNKEIQK